jgi:hypothetical protein
MFVQAKAEKLDDNKFGRGGACSSRKNKIRLCLVAGAASISPTIVCEFSFLVSIINLRG